MKSNRNESAFTNFKNHRRKKKAFFQSSKSNKRQRLSEIKDDIEAINMRFYKRGNL